MKEYKSIQVIGQLEKRKGGYYYLKIDREIISQFENGRKTRLICRLDDQFEFQCGLNHFGDGNFFIILSKKNLSKVNKDIGEQIEFEIREDPNPLGVEVPEVLSVLLEQDEDIRSKFEKLTMGKKRSVIHQMNRIKDLDKQIVRTIELINTAHLPRQKRQL